jgi:hypothetical protein
MVVSAPEWLTRRGGSVQQASTGGAWFVHFSGQPQYSLVPVPVGNAVGCAIRQTINGKRIESTSTATTPEQALQAGLEDLRKSLGW